MFLSKLELNADDPQARRDLGDAYAMHRSLTRAFASAQDSAPARFLWRLEADGSRSTPPSLLVQSNIPADWSTLLAITHYTQSVQANKAVALESLVQAGRNYRFRLIANPTVRRNGRRRESRIHFKCPIHRS